MVKRSYLPLVIALAISAVVAAGCAKKDAPKDDKSSTPTSSPTTTTSTPDKPAGSSDSSATTSSAGGALNSKDGRFDVVFPAGFPEAKSSTTKVPTAVGTVDMITYMAQKDENHVVMIAYADYPKEAIKAMGDNAKKVLNAAQDGAIKNMKATVTSQKDIEIDGHPARSFRFSMDAGGKTGYGQFNVTLVNERMYQVVYITTTEGDLDKDEIKGYFASFKTTH